MNFKEFIKESESIGYFYTVTPDVYYGFQRCSGDFNPLHTDELWAIKRGFPKCVMYGNILNAFVSHFVGMLLPSRNVIIHTQDISFCKPIYLNDKIHLSSCIENTSEAVGIVKFKLKFTKNIQDENGIQEITVAKGHVQIGLLEETGL